MAGLVQDDLQGEGDAEPGKPEEEPGEKALVFGKRIADARAEPHAENEREDHPRLNG